MSSIHTPQRDVVHITLVGAAGRMGRAIARCIADAPIQGERGSRVALHAGITRAGSSAHGTAIDGHPGVRYTTLVAALEGALEGASAGAHGAAGHVIADFSSPDSVITTVAAIRAKYSEKPRENSGFGRPETGVRRPAILVGVTGLGAEAVAALRGLCDRHAVMLTPNTSLGIAALASAAQSVVRALGPSYGVAITESHHAMKKDAPSGTALRLAEAIARAGQPVPREHIHSIRADDIVGTHTVTIAGPGEVIELTHRATTRDLFALGAITCAKFLAHLPPGWYTMDDLTGSFAGEVASSGRG